MINTLKNIFGMGPKVNFEELMKIGGIIVDVRSKAEYAGGHVKGSINIPLDQLEGNLSKLKSKNQPIIACCASGMRSGSATNYLRNLGYTNVHNGGSWHNLKQFSK